MKRNDVLRILQKERKELVHRYNISTLSVFGSVTRSDAREDRNVDILVEFTHLLAHSRLSNFSKG